MIKLNINYSFLIRCSFFILALSSMTSFAGNEITFEKNYTNLGNIDQFSEHPIVFSFTNTSSIPLKIVSVQSQSNLVSIKSFNKSLEPNTTGRIELLLSPDSLSGLFSSKVLVTWMASTEQQTELKVLATIVPQISFNPSFVATHLLDKTETYESRVGLSGKSATDKKPEDFDIHSSNQAITAKLSKQDNHQTPLALAIKLNKDLGAGKFREYIEVTLKSNPKIKAVVRIFGQKLGDIGFTPKRVIIPPDDTRPSPKYSVRLHGAKPFKITGIETLTNALETRIIKQNDGYGYTILISKKDPTALFLIDTIKVFTDQKDEPLIQIPVGSK